MGLKAQCYDHPNPSAIFIYCPSIPAAILFSILYGLLTLAHIILAVVHRKKFCWVIIMAGIWETSGFLLRTITIVNQFNVKLVRVIGNMSTLLVVLSPLWINAFVYMVFARMVYVFLPTQKVAGVHARKIGVIFVGFDILSFIIQSGAGIMVSVMQQVNKNTPQSVVNAGLNTYVGGLALQQFFIFGFIFLVIKFHKEALQTNPAVPGWKVMTYIMYIVLTLITIRILYRLIEYTQGVVSPLTSNEAYFYVFEAVTMFFAFLILAIWHPGTFLIGSLGLLQEDTQVAKGRGSEHELMGGVRNDEG